jgi:hypothetical protein
MQGDTLLSMPLSGSSRPRSPANYLTVFTFKVDYIHPKGDITHFEDCCVNEEKMPELLD